MRKGANLPRGAEPEPQQQCPPTPTPTDALPNRSRYFGEDFDLKTKFQRDDPGARVALPTQSSHSLWVLGGWMLAITDLL
ncbi:hypothetical protein SRHO_G00049900 [Serrasalmus rhombeus]